MNSGRSNINAPSDRGKMMGKEFGKVPPKGPVKESHRHKGHTHVGGFYKSRTQRVEYDPTTNRSYHCGKALCERCFADYADTGTRLCHKCLNERALSQFPPEPLRGFTVVPRARTIHDENDMRKQMEELQAKWSGK